jgi:sugar phosphate permease
MTRPNRIAAGLTLVGLILTAWISLFLLVWDNNISLIGALVGTTVLIAWAFWVLWSASQIALRAWRGERNRGLDYRTFAGGLAVGAVLAGGVMLLIKDQDYMARFDSFGPGFVLVLVGSFFLWAVVRDSSHDQF